ncbi:MAG: hypothetical protein ACP5M9_00250 [Candidatus Micrarchaeia archaeon]
MDIRIVVIGVIILLVSFFIASSVVEPSVAPQQLGNSTYINKIIVAQNSIVVSPIEIKNTSFFVFSYAASSPIDFYFMNQSGYNYINSYNAVNNGSFIYKNGPKLAGKGVLEYILNGTLGTTFPYTSNLSNYGYKEPNYFYNGSAYGPGSSIYEDGSYYLYFYNNNSPYINVTYRYSLIKFANITNGNFTESLNSNFVPGSLVSSLSFIIGIILIVYGVIRKPNDKKAQEVVDKKALDIYEELEKKNSTRKTKGSKEKRKRTKKK